jgi:hypothetical protein
MPFGQYCQISEEDTPRNSLAARTQGAIALGHSGNVQGGHKFWTLNTGSVVVRRDWAVLPMPQSVIDQINLKAKGQLALPIFTDQLGNPIGDTPVDAYQAYEPQESDDNLPGVEVPEPDQANGIPGLDTGSEMLLEPNVDVGIDFESPVPQEMPPVDTSSTEQPLISNPIQAREGVRRSTRVSSKPVNWNVSSWAGKKYVFATTQLGKSLLEDEDYQHNPQVAFAFMRQMSLKAALKQWGSDAEKAGIKEVTQLHWRDTFVPNITLSLQVMRSPRFWNPTCLWPRSTQGTPRLG